MSELTTLDLIAEVMRKRQRDDVTLSEIQDYLTMHGYDVPLRSYDERPKCRDPRIVLWRTPNEWVFVAVCETCGRVATTMLDGGTAIRLCDRLHDKEGS